MTEPIKNKATIADFNLAFDRLLGHEGGYTNDKNDKGGETNWGVTIHTARANGYTGSMRAMTREQAKQIYLKAFWQRYNCEKFAPEIAFQFFDAAVNHGFGNAARMLQRAVGVADDGVIGKITLAAIERHSVADVGTLFIAERVEFFTKLDDFSRYGKGWIRRMANNLRYFAKDTIED
ncbi:Predicted lysozyme (DUF847) [Mannheimia haemolytica]|uniref:Predicted lysozyme (DUF847) n=1 Tax=Mannheimia haemolytica TaxID=75985 RepID=A0A3S4Z3M4_MANHA|nr:glycosyl hydrolase 108 family protein [Mannheimia haemolytica]VEI74745.1 Predicted lysozyme (DUF847) [Mannheimia haemolytica]